MPTRPTFHVRPLLREDTMPVSCSLFQTHRLDRVFLRLRGPGGGSDRGTLQEAGEMWPAAQRPHLLGILNWMSGRSTTIRRTPSDVKDTDGFLLVSLVCTCCGHGDARRMREVLEVACLVDWALAAAALNDRVRLNGIQDVRFRILHVHEYILSLLQISMRPARYSARDARISFA